MQFHDLTGVKFGRLIVVCYAGNKQWNTLCECGATKVVYGNNLTMFRTRSCGCLNAEIASASPTKFKPTHGDSLSSEFKCWQNMQQRCYNPNIENYNNYGGRGIKVCDESYQNFIADMGRKPTPELSIDRIDNDGDYEPSNCRWADSFTQINNRGRSQNDMYSKNGGCR